MKRDHAAVFAFPELEPSLFSFNSPKGMCPECNGLGTVLSMDEEKIVPDKTLTIREGAVVPWQRYFNNPHQGGSWGKRRLEALEKQMGVNFDIPWSRLPKKQKDLCLRGSNGVEMTVEWKS